MTLTFRGFKKILNPSWLNRRGKIIGGWVEVDRWLQNFCSLFLLCSLSALLLSFLYNYLGTARPMQIIDSMYLFHGVLGTSSVDSHRTSSSASAMSIRSSYDSMISSTVDTTFPATMFACWAFSRPAASLARGSPTADRRKNSALPV